MTVTPEPDPREDDGQQPAGPGRPSDAEIDAQFAELVSGLRGSMDWGENSEDAPTTGGRESAEERARRRDLRRAERAEELAAFQAEQAAIEAEHEADDAHFTPPEPPPIPRPKRRTVAALLLLAAGVLLVVRPGLLSVRPDFVLVLALLLILGGAGLLVAGLRRRHAKPGDADGWDDGAQV